MALISFLYTSLPKPHLRPTSLFLFRNPSTASMPHKSVKIALLSTKIQSFDNMRLVSSRVEYGRVVARAGVDLDEVEPRLSGLGGVVESDELLSDVRKKAMDAVDACGGRITIGDVASKAGLKLDEAQKVLQALAADSNGFSEVSDEGDVLYIFPKYYRWKLAAKSVRVKFKPFVKKGKSAAKQVIKVSFGTALIASIGIVYATIIIVLLSSKK